MDSESTERVEEYAKENGISTEIAELALDWDLVKSGYIGVPLSLYHLPAFCIAGISGELKYREETAIKLLTDREMSGSISPAKKVALIKALFLIISPEVQQIIEYPWLLAYLVGNIHAPHSQPDLDVDQRLFLSVRLSPEDEGIPTTKRLLDEIKCRDFMVVNIAQLYRQGETVSTPAAFYCSFKDAAEIYDSRMAANTIMESPELPFLGSLPYNRFRRHRLIEIDPRRPKKVIMAAVERLIDEEQQTIRNEEAALDPEDPVEEWELTDRQIKQALEAYLVIKHFNWDDKDWRKSLASAKKMDNILFKRMSDLRYENTSLSWRSWARDVKKYNNQTFFDAPSEAAYPDDFVNRVKNEDLFSERMEKRKNRYRNHAKQILDSILTGKKISELEIPQN